MPSLVSFLTTSLVLASASLSTARSFNQDLYARDAIADPYAEAEYSSLYARYADPEAFPDPNAKAHPYAEPELLARAIETILDRREAAAAADAAAEPAFEGGIAMHIVQARGLDIQVGSQPSAAHHCPATNNGPGQDYAAHSYTANQIKSGMLEGAKLAAAGKTVGVNKYPHHYQNKPPSIPFPCGKNIMEFPMLTTGSAYAGEDTRAVSDRVVFEYSADKKSAKLKYCGVMRHGPGQTFISCP